MRHYFDKFGGNLGASGCVSWSFDKKGVIVIEDEDQELDEDEVMMAALDAGASDYSKDDDVHVIYTEPDDFNSVTAALEGTYTFASAQIEMVPQNYQTLEKEEDIKNMQKMLDAMEDDDDVQNVYHNWQE
jgi:transcriptional/translational regulatory protein YebC/TACO1